MITSSNHIAYNGYDHCGFAIFINYKDKNYDGRRFRFKNVYKESDAKKMLR
jgi:hypothetical protein